MLLSLCHLLLLACSFSFCKWTTVLHQFPPGQPQAQGISLHPILLFKQTSLPLKGTATLAKLWRIKILVLQHYLTGYVPVPQYLASPFPSEPKLCRNRTTQCQEPCLICLIISCVNGTRKPLCVCNCPKLTLNTLENYQLCNTSAKSSNATSRLVRKYQITCFLRTSPVTSSKAT